MGMLIAAALPPAAGARSEPKRDICGEPALTTPVGLCAKERT